MNDLSINDIESKINKITLLNNDMLNSININKQNIIVLEKIISNATNVFITMAENITT